ncbi:unnamed protein product [Trichobilharzia regenti]|nr:unnamed protein product [Trichobilharzia regenti]
MRYRDYGDDDDVNGLNEMKLNLGVNPQLKQKQMQSEQKYSGALLLFLINLAYLFADDPTPPPTNPAAETAAAAACKPTTPPCTGTSLLLFCSLSFVVLTVLDDDLSEFRSTSTFDTWSHFIR